MRFQNRLYIQNPNRGVRNKVLNNFNMSSDFCTFKSPTFDISGGGKIMTGTTISDNFINVVSSGTSLNFIFSFTGNVSTFATTNTSFKYKIYKFNEVNNVFVTPPIYESNDINYSTFSGSSAFTSTISISDLNLDGEYIIKGSYDFLSCTDMLNKLGVITNTASVLSGTEYGIYDSNFDYYFAAINNADIPLFNLGVLDTSRLGKLVVVSFELSGQTQVDLIDTWSGELIVSLNGLTLSLDNDYTVIDKTIVLNGTIVNGDILTVAYVVGEGVNGLTSESILVNGAIVSGVTDGEGSNLIYYNTDINKYEIYTKTNPFNFNDVVVTLNGVSLANSIDYYQSSVNPRRIILKGIIYGSGDLGDGNVGALADLITITYNSNTTYVGDIQVNTFNLYWNIINSPNLVNGYFTTLVSSDNSYGNIIYSSTTPYIVDEINYTSKINLSGYTGTTAFYKINNKKDYKLISGDIISSNADSESIPININI